MTKFLRNRCKVAILSLMIFLFPNVCFAGQINIQRPFGQRDISNSQLFNDFKKSFFERLEKNKYTLVQGSGEEKGEMKYMEITKGKERKISNIQKDALGRMIVNSKIYTLSKTPMGIKVEKWADKISSYTKIEYKKSRKDHAKFYFPGEVDNSDKGEYKISLSASLYPDLNSLRDDFSAEIKGYYGGLASILSFSPDANKMKMSFQYNNFAVWAGYEVDKKGSFGFLFEKRF